MTCKFSGKFKKYFILYILFLSIPACHKKNIPANQEKHVDIQLVHPVNIPYKLDYPATISGMADFPVISRINGLLFKQLYKEGSYVSKNQPLYQIDSRPFENQLAADEGALIKDQGALKEYRSILERTNKLYQLKALSKQDVETATINYNNTLGLVKTDEANIAQDKLNIQYCLVRAPVNGLISQRIVTIGSMVTAYQTVLNNINSSQELYVSFSVPENDRLDLQTGIRDGQIEVPKGYSFTVNLQLADGNMILAAGIVDFFDTRISLNNGTWNMRATLDNKKLNNQLLSGQFVHAYLTGAIFKNALAIIQSAVFRDDQGAFVYIINKQNIILKRSITTGAIAGNLWIIESGLVNNDKVVINGGMKVMPGDKIIIDSQTESSI